MSDKRPILVRMLWFVFAVIMTPLLAFWSAIDNSSPYMGLAWRDFKSGFIDWFVFLKRTFKEINRDI